jgi:hypothetical protein
VQTLGVFWVAQTLTAGNRVKNGCQIQYEHSYMLIGSVYNEAAKRLSPRSQAIRSR